MNNGDTLTGKVMDRDNSAFGGLLPKVKFRPDKGFRKKYKPSQLQAYKRGNDVFETIWISSESKIFKQRYFNKENEGEQHFVKVIYKGSIELYHWEFTDEDNAHIDHFPLLKKANSEEMVRATQGIFGLKRKVLSTYFEDCPSLVQAIQNKNITTVQQIIDFYETDCPNQ